MDVEQLREMLREGNVFVVFPKEKDSEEAAMALSDMIEGAVAVATFNDEEDESKISYGIIVQRTIVTQKENVNGEM